MSTVQVVVMAANRRIQQNIIDRSVRSICVIKPSALGDVVQSLPVVAQLKQKWPNAKLSWVISSSLKNLLEGYAGIDQLIEYERQGGLSHWIKLLGELRQQKFDLVLDLQGLLRTGVMTFATGAPYRIGLQTAREYSSLSCQTLIENTSRLVPAHQRYLEVGRFLELSDLQAQWDWGIQSQDRTRALHLIGDLKAPLIVIHAGAKWVTKRWPVENYARVVQQVTSTLAGKSGSIVLVGAPDESEINAQLNAQLGSLPRSWECRNLTGKTSLRELAVILKTAQLMISNDSGPMHLAAAMGTHVIGLFTCTSAHQSGPSGAGHRLFQAAVDCAASYCKQCPQIGERKHHCFSAIRPEQVAEAVLESLTQGKQAKVSVSKVA